MHALKSIVGRIRRVLSDAQRGIRHGKLDSVAFSSGLGDSATLLYGLVRSAKPTTVVEIGSARGRSTCHIAMALQANGVGKLYAIDPHMKTTWNDEGSVDTFEVLRENIRSLGLEPQVEIRRATSEEVARGWSEPIDVLFIDGDHSYEGVKRDWNLFSPFVRPFGTVIFHDTLWDLAPHPQYSRPDMGVPRFVEELRSQGFPVLTIDRDFGVSLVQPVRHGLPLRKPNAIP